MNEMLTLHQILGAMTGAEEHDLASLAQRLHRRQSYVRKGLIRLVARRGVARTERHGEAPTYRRLVVIETFSDETVPPPGATGAGKDEPSSDGAAVLRSGFGKASDPVVLPPRYIEGLVLDETLIVAMRGVYFNAAFDNARIAGETSDGKVPAIVALSIQERALRDAADMCRSRIEATLLREALA